MEYVTLNTGIQLPVIGSGTNTFGKVDHQYMGEINDDTSEILDAIALGYRHFDTAIMYRNERVVGKALKESGLDRKEFFITSKIPGEEQYYRDEQAVHEGVQQSLAALDTDYIDLYLIHHPWDNNDQIALVWRVLESYVEKGILKAIGVSNFSPEQLDALMKHSTIKPAVNQIESHPGKWNQEWIDFCLNHHVVPEAWGPLTRVSDEAKHTLSMIGDYYGKTWAQVILRYQLDQGVVVIPKSHHHGRQKQNLELFDFELIPKDRETIATL